MTAVSAAGAVTGAGRQQQRVDDGAHGALLGQHRAGRGLRVDEGGDGVRGPFDDVFEALLEAGARRRAAHVNAVQARAEGGADVRDVARAQDRSCPRCGCRPSSGSATGSAAAVVASPVLVTFV